MRDNLLEIKEKILPKFPSSKELTRQTDGIDGEIKRLSVVIERCDADIFKDHDKEWK
jgi:hypothetical protein